MFGANLKNKIRIDPEALDDPNPYDPEIEKQFKTIFFEISEHPELKDITLSGNWITAYELEKLAGILKNHQQLQFLNLDYNSIDLKAIPFLKKIIIDHPLLTHMNLCNNEIDDNALQTLLTDEKPEYTERVKKITFRFYDNKITENGVDFASDKLSLDSLSSTLAYNKVKEEVKIKYRKIIKEQKALTEHISNPPLLYSSAAMKNERADEKINPSESKSPPKPHAF